jgi:acetolactate synthase I/III small subunit
LSQEPASAYFLEHEETAEHRVTFAVLVDNEPGVLARVVGLFAARGYNIESLTVAATDHPEVSRITVVTTGGDAILEQIRHQLEKLVCVRDVEDVTRDPRGLVRELALVKVRGQGADRVEALRVADIFRAKVIDTTHESFIFELTGASTKIEAFVELMRPLGLVEVSRTGALSINRGSALSIHMDAA